MSLLKEGLRSIGEGIRSRNNDLSVFRRSIPPDLSTRQFEMGMEHYRFLRRTCSTLGTIGVVGFVGGIIVGNIGGNFEFALWSATLAINGHLLSREADMRRTVLWGRFFDHRLV